MLGSEGWMREIANSDQRVNLVVNTVADNMCLDYQLTLILILSSLFIHLTRAETEWYKYN